MIEILREETKVNVKFHTTIGGGWSWTATLADCHEPYAIMLKDRIQKDLSDKLERIRRESYEDGWRDAKAKKHGKKTWFKSWW